MWPRPPRSGSLLRTMPGKLAIHISKVDGTPEIQLIRVEGFLDAATYRELSTRAAPLVNRPKPYFVFDLSALEYLGSAGVASLMDIAYSSQDKDGEVALGGPSPKAGDVLKTLGLADILTILPSVAEAVESIRSGKASPGAESRSMVSVTANPFGTRAVEFVTSAAQPPMSSPVASVGPEASGVTEAKGDPAQPPATSPAASVGSEVSGVTEAKADDATGNALIRELAKAQLELVERIGGYLDEN